MITITRVSDNATTTPDDLTEYDVTRQGRSIVHDLLDGGVAVALVSPSPRSGSLPMRYSDETAALAGLALHEAESSFTLVDTDRPGLGMTYVVTGARLTLDARVDVWTLTINFQEVYP